MQLEKKEAGIENRRCAYTVKECLDSGSMSSVLWCVEDSPATIREIPLLLFIFVLAPLLECLSFIPPWRFTFTHFSIPFTVSIFATNLLFSFVLLIPTISCHPASVLPISVSSGLSWLLSPLCRSSFSSYAKTSWSCSHLFCILCVNFPCPVPSHQGGDGRRNTAHQRMHSQLLSIKSWGHSNLSSWDEQNCSCGGGYFHCGFK